MSEGPIGDLLHFVLFLAGAGVLGVVALGAIERLAADDVSARIGARHLLIAVGALGVAIAVEVAFHVFGGT